MADQTIYLNMV